MSNKISGFLSEIGATNRFRDPIYGYVWLSDDEVKIIDTPIYQRLRRIQQLALTKYVFPTAEHSRFAHSLGVVQCSTNIFLELLKKNEKIISEIMDDKELVHFFKVLRFAALLHDIGHLPFSHACENELIPGDNIKHEHISQYIVKHHPVISKILNKNEVRPEIIASIFIGEVIQKYNIIKKIISGVFDADRADYLLRDSYNCGVSYGNYDYIRYISSFQLERGAGKNFNMSVEYGNIQVLESFLLARYHYNMQIPYHRTRTGLDRVLQEYVKKLNTDHRLPNLFDICEEGKDFKEIDLDGFVYFDDFELFQEIKRDFKTPCKWAKILLREDHLFPIMDISGIDENAKNYYAEFVVNIKRAGFVENENFLTYRKNDIKIHSLVSESDEKNNDTVIKVKDKRNKDIGNIIECSPVLKALENKTVHFFRVYILSGQKEEAIKILDKLDKDLEERKKEIN